MNQALKSWIKISLWADVKHFVRTFIVTYISEYMQMAIFIWRVLGLQNSNIFVKLVLIYRKQVLSSIITNILAVYFLLHARSCVIRRCWCWMLCLLLNLHSSIFRFSLYIEICKSRELPFLLVNLRSSSLLLLCFYHFSKIHIFIFRIYEVRFSCTIHNYPYTSAKSTQNIKCIIYTICTLVRYM